MTSALRMLLFGVVAAACCNMSAFAASDRDGVPPGHTGAATVSALTTEQRDGADIAVAHPRTAALAQQWSAFGQVLDVSSLVADFGQLEAAATSARVADAELKRLQGLYKAEAASSLKMVQAAQAEQVRARTQYEVASSTCIARWGALATLPAEERRRMIERAAAGRHVLVRASLLGRQSVGKVPDSATVEVDGIQVPARVVGVTAQGSADLQSAGVLLEVSSAPAGLGPGARVPVTLAGERSSGALVPDAALIYGEQGARVFRQLGQTADSGKWRYAEVPVELLQRRGDGWLVRGVTSADLVVVRGAGALWSLQAANVTTNADDDDD